jgi:hypothetical protein
VTARWNNLPGRCKCGHGVSAHTGGSGQCWTHPCGCQSFRDKAEIDAAQGRHPAGKALDTSGDAA